jgi:hypothetical protein
MIGNRWRARPFLLSSRREGPRGQAGRRLTVSKPRWSSAAFHASGEPAVIGKPAGARPTEDRSCFRPAAPSFVRWPDETACPEPGRLAVPLLLDEREILSHIVESLKDRRQGNLIVPSELFLAAGIRSMDGLVNHRRSNPSTLDPQLPVIRARTGLEVLVLRFRLGDPSLPSM